MMSHLRLLPDLLDFTLEDRILLASGVPSFLYPTSSPMILTTSGFVMITTPSVMASSTGTGTLSIGLGVYGGTSLGLGGASSYGVTAFGLAFYAASVSAANLLSPSGSGGSNTLTGALVGSGASADGGAGGGVSAPRATVTNAVVGGDQNGQPVFQFIGQSSGSGMPAPPTGQAQGQGSGSNAPASSGMNAAPGSNPAPPPQIGAPPRMNPTSESGLPTIPNAVPTLPRAPGAG
jgi:hypothetical protein